LRLLGISLSTDTIEKILKPLEGQHIDENGVQSVLQEILPQDEQVNDEAAQALVALAPEVKEAALTNSKLNEAWLGTSLESSSKDQGLIMARIAPQFRDFIQLDPAAFGAAQHEFLARWAEISQEVTATEGSEVRHIEQNTEGAGEQAAQWVRASGQSTIDDVKQNIRLT
jgi:hypothetical protein